ncbi:hypothetical protein BIFPSEUDO_02604 [Bifidobacterium pseudocatenulatum DSM 20438 = JCM 1200 = LMG 10505]|uniref:Uncharacterized protein n=1 Tax=Bifidobacterium pseudocatenulatum DSM 20438 = JCM 1200 = LMG 10505 TaxID=547043 RepID=C0BQF8_BIFPS|nr:hypothetical protein BIFPSEUDO_02604 [Bifidobacterium pseudocatenulatum DSM 20438 = JCM 1200 = LMG 10505]
MSLVPFFGDYYACPKTHQLARIHENGNYGTFGVSQFPFSIDLWYFIGLSYL